MWAEMVQSSQNEADKEGGERESVCVFVCVCVSPNQPLLQYLQVVHFVCALVTRIEKSIPKMMLWRR